MISKKDFKDRIGNIRIHAKYAAEDFANSQLDDIAAARQLRLVIEATKHLLTELE
jgi:uncharacterized protein with HEPN domain